MGKWYLEKDRNMDTGELKYFKKDLSEFDSPDQPGSGTKKDGYEFHQKVGSSKIIVWNSFQNQFWVFGQQFIMMI